MLLTCVLARLLMYCRRMRVCCTCSGTHQGTNTLDKVIAHNSNKNDQRLALNVI